MTVRMWIDNRQVGTIIGKGGVNIKAIREQSACKVSIAELVQGASERLVSTTGSPAGINKATQLMLDVLEDSDDVQNIYSNYDVSPEVQAELEQD